MKPRLIDRILLVVILLIFVAGLVAVFLCAVNVFDISILSSAIDSLDGSEWWHYVFRGGIAFVVFVFVIISLRLMFTGNKTKEVQTSNMSLLSSDENGCAYVSSATIDSMVQKHVKTNGRIKECTSSVKVQVDGSVVLDVKLTVLADTNMPELCQKLRTELKEYIETYSGITVNQVSILIVNTYQAAASRVG